MRNNDALLLLEYIYNITKEDKYACKEGILQNIKIALDMLYDTQQEEELSQGEIQQFIDFLNEVRG